MRTVRCKSSSICGRGTEEGETKLITDDELRTNWRNVEDQTKQITILAELNACSAEEITQRLVKLGLLEG